jgi:hypothetical protein
MLLTNEEWEKLSPESRHKLNVLVQKVESFVRGVYGDNEILANMALVEMGVLPNTACSGLAICPTCGDPLVNGKCPGIGALC